MRTDEELAAEDEECLENVNLQSWCMKRRFEEQLENLKQLKSPIARKVIDYILENDFPIPKIQFYIENLFETPNTIKQRELRKDFPDYECGGFQMPEDAIIVQRLC